MSDTNKIPTIAKLRQLIHSFLQSKDEPEQRRVVAELRTELGFGENPLDFFFKEPSPEEVEAERKAKREAEEARRNGPPMAEVNAAGFAKNPVSKKISEEMKKIIAENPALGDEIQNSRSLDHFLKGEIPVAKRSKDADRFTKSIKNEDGRWEESGVGGRFYAVMEWIDDPSLSDKEKRLLDLNGMWPKKKGTPGETVSLGDVPEYEGITQGDIDDIGIFLRKRVETFLEKLALERLRFREINREEKANRRNSEYEKAWERFEEDRLWIEAATLDPGMIRVPPKFPYMGSNGKIVTFLIPKDNGYIKGREFTVKVFAEEGQFHKSGQIIGISPRFLKENPSVAKAFGFDPNNLPKPETPEVWGHFKPGHLAFEHPLRVRHIGNGAVTFFNNWGQEFTLGVEEVSFNDRGDVIGYDPHAEAIAGDEHAVLEYPMDAPREERERLLVEQGYDDPAEEGFTITCTKGSDRFATVYSIVKGDRDLYIPPEFKGLVIAWERSREWIPSGVRILPVGATRRDVVNAFGKTRAEPNLKPGHIESARPLNVEKTLKTMVKFRDERGILHKVPKNAVSLNENGEIVGYSPTIFKKKGDPGISRLETTGSPDDGETINLKDGKIHLPSWSKARASSPSFEELDRAPKTLKTDENGLKYVPRDLLLAKTLLGNAGLGEEGEARKAAISRADEDFDALNYGLTYRKRLNELRQEFATADESDLKKAAGLFAKSVFYETLGSLIDGQRDAIKPNYYKKRADIAFNSERDLYQRLVDES